MTTERRFSISAVAGMDAVVEAIKRLNGFGVPTATEVLRPGLFSESGCLTITDMKDFGTWLTTISTVTSAELSAKITEFMKRRLVKLNIALAPAEKIKDAPCMHPVSVVLPSVWLCMCITEGVVILVGGTYVVSCTFVVAH